MKKSKAAALVSQKCRSTWEDLDLSPHHIYHIITWLEEIGMEPPPNISSQDAYGNAKSMWEPEINLNITKEDVENFIQEYLNKELTGEE